MECAQKLTFAMHETCAQRPSYVGEVTNTAPTRCFRLSRAAATTLAVKGSGTPKVVWNFGSKSATSHPATIPQWCTVHASLDTEIVLHTGRSSSCKNEMACGVVQYLHCSVQHLPSQICWRDSVSEFLCGCCVFAKLGCCCMTQVYVHTCSSSRIEY